MERGVVQLAAGIMNHPLTDDPFKLTVLRSYKVARFLLSSMKKMVESIAKHKWVLYKPERVASVEDGKAPALVPSGNLLRIITLKPSKPIERPCFSAPSLPKVEDSLSIFFGRMNPGEAAETLEALDLGDLEAKRGMVADEIFIRR